MEEVPYYQSFFYVFKILYYKIMSWYNNNLQANYFNIKKTCKLIVKKYYWLTLNQGIESYIKSCDVYFILKVVCRKPNKSSLSLPIFIQYWKDVSINFVIDLLILKDRKKDDNNLILFIVDMLIKIVRDKAVKTRINVFRQVKIIIDVIVRNN